MQKKIGIKDIAKRAGVSTGTVDRVIHNRGNVSPSAKKSVLEAMQDLNYRRNRIASSLAYNRIWKIAVLIPKSDRTGEGFWEQVINGVEWASELVIDYGLKVTLFKFDEDSTDEFRVKSEAILAQDFDAVLVAPIFYDAANHFFNRCKEQHLKYAQINTFIERTDEEFLFYLGQDSFHSGFLAGKLLAFGLNHHCEAMVLHLEKSVYNSAHLVEKEKGFEEYFKSHSHTSIKRAAFHQVNQKKEFEAFMKRQLEAHPRLKGIFVTTARAHHLVPILDKLGRSEIKFCRIRSNT